MRRWIIVLIFFGGDDEGDVIVRINSITDEIIFPVKVEVAR